MPFFSKDPLQRKYSLLGMKIASNFVVSIALPAVLFTYIGQRFDTHYDTGYRYTIIAMALSIIVVVKIIKDKAKKYTEEFKKIEEEEKNKKD